MFVHRSPVLAAIGVLLPLLGLNACSLGMSLEAGSLAGACQFRPCECVGGGGAFGIGAEQAPIVWLDTGDATCPEGFRLRLASK